MAATVGGAKGVRHPSGARHRSPLQTMRCLTPEGCQTPSATATPFRYRDTAAPGLWPAAMDGFADQFQQPAQRVHHGTLPHLRPVAGEHLGVCARRDAVAVAYRETEAHHAYRFAGRGAA